MPTARKSGKWLAGVALSLILLPGAVPARQATASAGLVPDGAPPALDVLFTGDVIGYVDPCG